MMDTVSSVCPIDPILPLFYNKEDFTSKYSVFALSNKNTHFNFQLSFPGHKHKEVTQTQAALRGTRQNKAETG